MTKSVGVHEAKTQLSRLLAAVEQGEDVAITRRGVVVARLVGPERRQRRLGGDAGLYEVPEDFDHPLSQETLESFDR